MTLREENNELKDIKDEHEVQLTSLEQELLDTRNKLADVSILKLSLLER